MKFLSRYCWGRMRDTSAPSHNGKVCMQHAIGKAQCKDTLQGRHQHADVIILCKIFFQIQYEEKIGGKGQGFDQATETIATPSRIAAQKKSLRPTRSVTILEWLQV